MRRIRILSSILLLFALILGVLPGCRAKTGINAIIGDAAFVSVRIWDGEVLSEVTIDDEDDVEALKEACQVLGECEDGGYGHDSVALIFAGEDRELIVYPAAESSDYMLTGDTYYRTGSDRRRDLVEILGKYGVILPD